MDDQAAPAPGWYDDPSGAAPYRWWDGGHWTPATLDERPQPPTTARPSAPVTSTDAVPSARALSPAGSSDPVTAAADGSLPSRRSLRQSTAAPDAAWTAPGTTAAAPGTPATPPAAAAAGDAFVAPAAWAAHAPVATPVATEPALLPYGARGGLPPAGYEPAWTPVSSDRNQPARWALTLALLVIVISSVVNGLARASGFGATGGGLLLLAAVGMLMILAIVAVVPLAIVGLVRAHRVALGGQRPRGRPHAIIGLVLAVLIGLASGSSLSAGFEDGLHRGSTASTAVPPTIAPVAPTAPAQAPDAGTAQDQGGSTTYVYSQALTQSSLAQAIAAKTNITPNSVQCPASEPLVIGTTFDCSVALPSTGTLTVEVTVLSEQGQLSFQALP